MIDGERVAAWIEEGLKHPKVVESRGGILIAHKDGWCDARVLGLALIGKIGTVAEAAEIFKMLEALKSNLLDLQPLAWYLEIPLELVKRIDDVHFSQIKRKTTALEIATMLRRGEL